MSTQTDPNYKQGAHEQRTIKAEEVARLSSNICKKYLLITTATSLSAGFGSYALGKIIPPEIVLVGATTLFSTISAALYYIKRNQIAPLPEAIYQFHKADCAINNQIQNEQESAVDNRISSSRFGRALLLGSIALTSIISSTIGSRLSAMEIIKNNTPKADPTPQNQEQPPQAQTATFHHSDIPAFS